MDKRVADVLAWLRDSAPICVIRFDLPERIHISRAGETSWFVGGFDHPYQDVAVAEWIVREGLSVLPPKRYVQIVSGPAEISDG